MFEEEKSEKTNICRNFVRFMEAVSYQPWVKLGNFLSASIHVPTFHVPARSFFFSAESFSNNWEIAMENLLNPVDPVVHGQVVHRRSQRSHFFCGAILHLSSFVFNWEKKRKRKGKDRWNFLDDRSFLFFFFYNY